MCPAKDILSAYLDDELPASYTAQIQVHIGECQACTNLLAQFKNLSTSLKPINQEMINKSHANCWQGILNRIFRQRTVITRVIRMPFPAFALIALLLIIGSSGLTLLLSSADRQQTEHLATMEIPLFTSIEELVSFLDTYHAMKTIKMNLPEDSRFMVTSKPVLIHEADYRQMTW